MFISSSILHTPILPPIHCFCHYFESPVGPCFSKNFACGIIFKVKSWTGGARKNSHFCAAPKSVVFLPGHDQYKISTYSCSYTRPMQVKIPILHTNFKNGDDHQIIYLPFQITDLGLIFNTSGLDGSLKRQLQLKGVRDLISTKIPRPLPIDAGLNQNQVQLHKTFSIGALSLSSSVIVIIIATVILLVVFKAKIAEFFR